ncbi:tRNA lysidine(34) synthetase TilS [Oharaeibacter diazotrophicus]|uniref:tRNA(Ile)-lysidine synthase n=2 Tax=Oharaeibacter diazotrophicus TaxID=1920512 RepID=A0A4V3CW58_9HYPH|nr:tRNA lysidine(34) synthetase TilS [Oharaeibacter diazotrophicus]TDP85088.1 tRNA(Ile)-lysidine synthase [Oharaeibacter diazotrophicus]BBE74059.1 tRNA (Ile)-lysidine synthase [Pleomorphomonas sp. SM30]GLS76253.1 hypothetical protein GCM10007904_15880 [Oharaeibacter diazotrophicus]
MSAAAPDRPVGDDEARDLLAPLEGLAAVGVAVSGGPDSTALLLIADRWARATSAPPDLHVLTVDHGLRTAARAEAEAVAALAGRLGRPAEILVWDHAGAPPAADLQAAARAARYSLLADAARRRGLAAVLLAHTRDDVAETFLIRLARGSGLAGLAAMRPERIVDGVRFLRPLLAVPKARLAATVAAAGLVAADDPSNRADRFLRARIRATLPALAALGLTPERLAATAHRLARAAAVVEAATADLRAGAVTDHGGVFAVDAVALAAAPAEVGLRLLSDLARAVRPGDYGPRAAPLEAWLDAFAAGAAPRRTVAGVVLDARRRRAVWLYAEAGRAGFPVLALDRPGRHVWDGRFAVDVAVAPPPGARVVAGRDLAALPRAAAAGLPRLDGWDPPPGAVVLRPLGAAGTSAGDEELVISR